MQFLKDIFYLFFPKLCVGCDNQLTTQENILCIKCIHNIPLTHFETQQNNTVANIFKGRVNIDNAFSYIFYREKGITQKLLYQLKQKNNEQVAQQFAIWMAYAIKNSNSFKDLDMIVSVPLHKKRQRRRGFNQLDYFGKALSQHLNIPYNNNILTKTKHTVVQKSKNRIERWNNVANSFETQNEYLIKGKHILLIDDVITTGATLEACAVALQKTKGVKTSIITIAYAE